MATNLSKAKPVSWQNPAITGAIIAFVVISAFLYAAGEGKPEWGQYWRVRPLIITPLVGAMGGVFFSIVRRLLYRRGWQKALALILGIIGYIVALWLGIVLGLDGTLWD